MKISEICLEDVMWVGFDRQAEGVLDWGKFCAFERLSWQQSVRWI